MSRPTNADSSETRARILALTVDLLNRCKPSEFSMRAVARLADVSVGTLQYYFTTKSELVGACVDEVYYAGFAATSQSFFAEADLSSGVVSVVEQAARIAFRYALEHRGFVRMVLAEAVNDGVLGISLDNASHAPAIKAALTLIGTQESAREKTILLGLNTTSLVIARYAGLTDAEHCRLTRCTDPAEALAALEEQVVAVALALVA